MLDYVPVHQCWNISRFMAVWPWKSCYDSSLHCNILGIKFIILWPQIQSSRFISALSLKVFVPTFQLQQINPEKSSNTTSAKEQDPGEGSHEAESAALMGSYSAQLGCSNPYLYDQFSLQTTEQRINQIILLQVGTCSKDRNNINFSNSVM